MRIDGTMIGAVMGVVEVRGLVWRVCPMQAASTRGHFNLDTVGASSRKALFGKSTISRPRWPGLMAVLRRLDTAFGPPPRTGPRLEVVTRPSLRRDRASALGRMVRRPRG
jgi:hypothetical protein